MGPIRIEYQAKNAVYNLESYHRPVEEQVEELFARYATAHFRLAQALNLFVGAFSSLVVTVRLKQAEEVDPALRTRLEQIERLLQAQFAMAEGLFAALRRDLDLELWPIYEDAPKQIALEPALYDIYRSVEAMFRLVNSPRATAEPSENHVSP